MTRRLRLCAVAAVALLCCLAAGCARDPAGGMVVRGYVNSRNGVVDELRTAGEVAPWVPGLKRPIVLWARCHNSADGKIGHFVFLVDTATGTLVDMRPAGSRPPAPSPD